MRREYYPHFKRGLLLVAGGLSDQPARYLGYMRELTLADDMVDRIFNTPPDSGGESQGR